MKFYTVFTSYVVDGGDDGYTMKHFKNKRDAVHYFNGEAESLRIEAERDGWVIEESATALYTFKEGDYVYNHAYVELVESKLL